MSKASCQARACVPSGRADLVDEPHRHGLLCWIQPAQEPHLASLLLSDQADHLCAAVASVKGTDFGTGLSEHGVVGGNLQATSPLSQCPAPPAGHTLHGPAIRRLTPWRHRTWPPELDTSHTHEAAPQVLSDLLPELDGSDQLLACGTVATAQHCAIWPLVPGVPRQAWQARTA